MLRSDSFQILKKGFDHEQSRADRDNFVTVNYANIEPGNKNFNFE